MSQVPAQPYTGPLTINLNKLASVLVDLPPGGTQRLRVEREGMSAVVAELASGVPSCGAAAGIPADVYDHFVTHTDTLEQLRAARDVVAKLAEILAESEAKCVHERENDLAIIVDAVRSMSRRKGDAGMLAPFEKTIAYNAQTALKAVKTRKKNAEAQKPSSAAG